MLLGIDWIECCLITTWTTRPVNAQVMSVFQFKSNTLIIFSLRPSRTNMVQLVKWIHFSFIFSIIRMWREMMNMSKYMHLCFMTNFSKSKYYRDRNKLETGLSIDSRQVHYHTCRACPKIGLLQSYGVKLTDLLPFFSIKSRTSPRDQLGHSWDKHLKILSSSQGPPNWTRYSACDDIHQSLLYTVHQIIQSAFPHRIHKPRFSFFYCSYS